MVEHNDIPKAPANRPDLAEAWALVGELEQSSDANYRHQTKSNNMFDAVS